MPSLSYSQSCADLAAPDYEIQEPHGQKENGHGRLRDDTCVSWFLLVDGCVNEYGPIVILLFLSLIGNLLLSVMALIKIERTWKPLGLMLLGGFLTNDVLRGRMKIKRCFSIVLASN